ncbi:MAG TPA: DUF5658 family protein [Bryobacteraceae bacterium]|nr:DUF5658 family protein [Bryobacteraceae bacterium]
MIATLRRPSFALPVFLTLQCLDVLTTLLFLRRGIGEGNVLVAWILPQVQTPWTILALAKVPAMTMGYYWYRRGRVNVMQLANFGYAAVVLWNIATIAMA